jgi:addiction module HigA family antidote
MAVERIELTNDYDWLAERQRYIGAGATTMPIAIHPGEYLAEILTECGISQADFARAVGVSPMRISYVVKGARPVTAELALLFGKALGQTPEYWLNLQTAYDLTNARSVVAQRLKRVPALTAA